MEIGRVFYDDPFQPRKVTALSLQSHVRNVVALVEQWSHEKAYRTSCDLSQTREWLLEAARRHDEAKPQTFAVTFHPEHGFGYSFRGHRFRVPCENLYVDGLIRLHHEFSVDGVAEWQAKLRQHPEFASFADHFPLDLYTLEMCDQVAAEAESYGLGKGTDERAFMELHSRWRDEAARAVEFEPFPFAASYIPLTLKFAILHVDEALEAELEKEKAEAKEQGKPRKVESLKKALEALSDEDLQEVTVKLCAPAP